MNFVGKKVLVTGGNGFIGRNLTNCLISLGANVAVTVRQRSTFTSKYSWHWSEIDLRRKEDCARVVKGQDYVFHCAAVTSGAAVMNDSPASLIGDNLTMNANMLEAAHAAGVNKFAFISSSAVYPITDQTATEFLGNHGNPPDCYFGVGWMKRYSEKLCEFYSNHAKYPMATVVVRPSNIYGPMDKFDERRSHVTASLIRKVVNGDDPVVVWGDGQDSRDLIYVDDFIDGLLAVFDKTERHSVVNVVSGRNVTVLQILQEIIQACGLKSSNVVCDKSKPSMARSVNIDALLAEKEYGWFAKTPLQEGLKRTVDWYRENKDRWNR